MPSVTYWNRLEPSPRDESMQTPMQARIRDALWMITRQWQVGEFQGADSGSPAYLEVGGRIARMTGWQVEGQPVQPLGAMPFG